MNLFKVLLISWLTGVGLSYFKNIPIDYAATCLSMAAIYFIMALFCYHYIGIELKSKHNINAYIISALCFCMIISSWFNYIFVNPDMYHLLIDSRRGSGFSWNNIYKTVELLALLMVGKDGIIYIYNWLVCRCRRINVIIANNSTYNLGR